MLSGVGVGAGAARAQSKHAANIVDRPLPKTAAAAPTVAFSAWAHLFSELISYSMGRAATITELEERLDAVGYEVGTRMMELLSYREKQVRVFVMRGMGGRGGGGETAGDREERARECVFARGHACDCVRQRGEEQQVEQRERAAPRCQCSR